MHEYYFTFGSAHYTLEEHLMRDYWVRVTAPHYMAARFCFCKEFAAPIMGKADKWAFQYDAADFDKSYCPAGEYAHLVATDIPVIDLGASAW